MPLAGRWVSYKSGGVYLDIFETGVELVTGCGFQVLRHGIRVIYKLTPSAGGDPQEL